MDIPVITIDGPTASGKGTIAGTVAKALGFHYLDSGALFRLATLACEKAQVDLADETAVAKIARAMQIKFTDGKIFLDGAEVTDAIRAEKIGINASKIAVLPRLREAILALEYSFLQLPGLVADGRDMGSVVFKNARLKVFLTASAQKRAQRRYTQLIQKGVSANLRALTSDLEERDKRDRERKNSPTQPAPDAKLLDSSDLTIEQTVEKVLTWWRASA